MQYMRALKVRTLPLTDGNHTCSTLACTCFETYGCQVQLRKVEKDICIYSIVALCDGVAFVARWRLVTGIKHNSVSITSPEVITHWIQGETFAARRIPPRYGGGVQRPRTADCASFRTVRYPSGLAAQCTRRLSTPAGLHALG